MSRSRLQHGRGGRIEKVWRALRAGSKRCIEAVWTDGREGNGMAASIKRIIRKALPEIIQSKDATTGERLEACRLLLKILASGKSSYAILIVLGRSLLHWGITATACYLDNAVCVSHACFCARHSIGIFGACLWVISGSDGTLGTQRMRLARRYPHL